MKKIELDQADYEAIANSFDVDKSIKRLRAVLWSSFAVALVGLGVVIWGGRDVALFTLVAVFMLYVLLAGLERASYLRAIMKYKAALRKLTTQFDSEHERSLRQEAKNAA